MSRAANVPCPNCRKPSLFSEENHFRPFCSERCQLIDLGEWFNEAHKIAGEDSIDAIDPDNSPIN